MSFDDYLTKKYGGAETSTPKSATEVFESRILSKYGKPVETHTPQVNTDVVNKAVSDVQSAVSQIPTLKQNTVKTALGTTAIGKMFGLGNNKTESTSTEKKSFVPVATLGANTMTTSATNSVNAQRNLDKQRAVELVDFDANDTSDVLYSGNGFNVTRAKLDKWLDPDYKLSNEEKKQARAYYFANNFGNMGKQITSLFSGDKDAKADTNESRLELATLLPKFSALASAGHGFVNSVPGAEKLMKGVGELSDLMYGTDTDEQTENLIENAQNSGAFYELGKAGGKITQYYMLNASGVLAPVASKIGGWLTPALSKAIALGPQTLGASEAAINASLSLGEALAGKAGNILADEVADILLDTLPEMAANIQDGMSGKEVAEAVFKNLGINLAYNVGGQLVADFGEIKQALKGKYNLSDEAAEQIAKNLTENIDDVAKETAGEVADVVKATEDTKIAPNLPQTDTIAKQTENLPQNGLTPLKGQNDNLDKLANDVAVPKEEVPILPKQVEEFTDTTVKTVPDADTLLKETAETSQIKPNTVEEFTEDTVKNSPMPEQLSIPGIPKEPEIGLSRVYTNTLSNNGLVDMATEADKRGAQYVKHYNSAVLKDATNDVMKNGDSLIESYVSGAKAIVEDGDADRVMLLLNRLSDEVENGIANGLSPQELALKQVQLDTLRLRFKHTGSQDAQFLQALAKWNGTAEGAVANGEKIREQIGNVWAKNNKKTSKQIDKSIENLAEKTSTRLDKAFENMGYKGAKSLGGQPITHEQIEQQVRNTLKNEFAAINQQFTEDDVKYLTNLVENKVSVDTITDELEHRLKHGSWYTIDESLPVREEINNKLASTLESIGNKSTPNAKAVIEKNPGQIRREIENTLKTEYGSVLGDLSEKDMDILVQLVMDKRVNKEILRDEIEHYLKHGTFFEIDDSFFAKPIKEVTNKRLDDILSNIGKTKDDVVKATATPKTFEQVREEVTNSLAKEYASVLDDLSPAEIDYITTLVMDKSISKELIQDEIEHRLKYGNFFTIDESIIAKQAENTRLKNILSDMMNDTPATPKPQLSYDEVRAQVKETLQNELASINDFTDADIDYVTALIQSGLTSKEISTAIKGRIANGSWSLSNDCVKKVNELYEEARHYKVGSKQRADIEEQMLQTIADEIHKTGGTILEKYDGWRYIAMLGNLKTMIKNLASTAEMHAVDGISNSLAAVIESALNKSNVKKGKETFEQTKAILGAGDADLIKQSRLDAIDTSYVDLTGKGRYRRPMDEINRLKKVFSSDAMNKLAKLPSQGLEKGDDFFLYNKYATSLAGYLKANGYDKSIFDAEAKLAKLLDDGVPTMAKEVEIAKLQGDIELLNRAREYAIKKAQYATFHADSKFASAIQQFKRSMNESDSVAGQLAGKLLEGLVPFVKTPVNVLKNTFDFSPASIMTGINKMRKGDIAEGIDALAKGTTGTGLLLLGWALADAGILEGKQSDYDKSKGYQDYSINAFGKSISIADITSGNAMLLVGVALSDAMQSKGYDFADFAEALQNGDLEAAYKATPINEMVDSFATVVEPISETSMLTGISNAINSVKYSDAPVPAMIGSLLTGYLTQGIPTMAGQGARTIDNTRRSTYVDSTGFTGSVERGLEKIQNKIPVASTFNEPYVDMWGREQSSSPTDNPLLRTGYQFLFPAYMGNTSEAQNDPVFKELDRLISSDSGITEEDVVPGLFKSKVDGTKMSQEEYTQYSKETGQARYKGLSFALNNPEYQALSDKSKAEVIKKIYTLSDYIGENAVTGKGSSESNSLYKTYYNNGSPSLRNAINQIVTDQFYSDRNLKSNNGDAQAAFEQGGQEALDAYVGLTTEQTQASQQKVQDLIPTLDYTQILTNSDDPNVSAYVSADKAIPYLDSLGIDNSTKGEILYNSGVRSDKEVKAYNNMGGYEGVYEYYKMRADASDLNKGGSSTSLDKSEIAGYLYNLYGYDLDLVNQWYDVLDKNPIDEKEYITSLEKIGISVDGSTPQTTTQPTSGGSLDNYVMQKYGSGNASSGNSLDNYILSKYGNK